MAYGEEAVIDYSDPQEQALIFYIEKKESKISCFFLKNSPFEFPFFTNQSCDLFFPYR